MQTSETGSRPLSDCALCDSRRDLGLTLIEVLLVVFLVGLASTLVIMTLPARTESDQESVERFVMDLVQMRRDAIYFGQPVGVSFEGENYDILRWVDGAWHVERSSDALSRGQEIQMAGQAKPVSSDGWPDYVFDPTGVGSSALIEISGFEADYLVQIDVSGEVRFDRF